MIILIKVVLSFACSTVCVLVFVCVRVCVRSFAELSFALTLIRSLSLSFVRWLGLVCALACQQSSMLLDGGGSSSSSVDDYDDCNYRHSQGDRERQRYCRSKRAN